jgi:glycosyltransferase involved in cell wall biosynthesis
MPDSGSIGKASKPQIAVVVCTRNRAALLRRTLESLVHQTLEQTAYQVVVVDDGSTDDTRQVSEAFASRVPLRYIGQRHAGLASAKNLGLFSTLAPLVLFMDDDDLADRELLAQHVETHSRFADDRYAVLGYTGLDASLAADPLMRFVTEVGCFLFSYPLLAHGALLDYTHFWGGRSSCKRSFLLRHGIFNPVFQFGCEDIELGFRLSRHDFQVVYNRRAISTMVRGITVEEFCARLLRQGRSNVVFSRLHHEAEIQDWTEVAGADKAWRTAGVVYDAVVRSAQQLDQMARRKRKAGLELEAADCQWLHRAYSLAFRASKLKGIHEALMESEN